MKVYLDDERATPEGWHRVFLAEQAIEMLKTGKVTHISLDHDLGNDKVGTGYDVVLWIEQQVICHNYVPPVITVHSANTSAAIKMRQGIQTIYEQYALRANQ